MNTAPRDCQRCGKNHYDMRRPMVPTCPFVPTMPSLPVPVARLLLALQSIAKNTCCGKCQEAAVVARDALQKFEASRATDPT